MKILINRKPVEGPWGGGNLFVSSFCEYFSKKGCHVVHQLEPGLDVIFMQDPRYSDLGISINEISNYKNANPKTRVFHRVNECDARKGTNDIDSLLRACSALTDHTIFVSKWMREYHLSKGWKCENSSVIYNGVNLDHFKKIIPCGIKDKKIISLKEISNIRYNDFTKVLEKKLIKNLSLSNYS